MMMNITSILFFSLFLVIAFSQDHLKPLKIDQFSLLAERLKSNSHLLHLVIITKFENCSRCEQGNKEIEKFAEKIEGVVQTVMVDCVKIWENPLDHPRVPACDPSKGELPHISFFVPNYIESDPYNKGNRKLPRDVAYTGIVSLDGLMMKANELMPSFYKKIENLKEMKEYLDNKEIPMKFLYFTTEDVPPIYLKSLTCQFRGLIDFAIVDGDNSKILKYFKVKEIPLYLALRQSGSDYEQEVYQEETNMEKMSAYLHQKWQVWGNQVEKQVKQGEFSDVPLQNIPVNIRSSQIAAVLKKHPDNVIVLQLYKGQKEPNKSKGSGSIFQKVQDDLLSLAFYYNVQCSERECDEILAKGVIQYPKTVVFNIYHKQVKDGYILTEYSSKEDLFKILFDQLPETDLHSDEVSEMSEMRNKVLNGVQQDKYSTLFFVDKYDFQTRFVMFIVSQQSRFKKYMKFIFAVNPKLSDLQTWGVLESPGLMTVTKWNQVTSDIQRSPYDSNDMSFSSLIDHLNQLAIRKMDELLDSNPIKEIKQFSDFEEQCLDHKESKACVIGLFDGKKSGKLQQDLQKLTEIRKLYTQNNYSFTYIDAGCHSEFLKPFRLPEESLNTLFYLDKKKEKYRILKEPFETKNLVKFFDQMKGKLPRGTLSPLPSSIEIDERNCEAQHKIGRQKLEEERKKRIEKQYKGKNKNREEENNNDEENEQREEL